MPTPISPCLLVFPPIFHHLLTFSQSPCLPPACRVQVLRPRKSVVIAFDGPAPLAKIMTQRKRRSSEKELATPINSLHLSPGYVFSFIIFHTDVFWRR